MHECPICHHDHSDTPAVCRGCWYGGALLAHNMRPVIAVLEAATGTKWHAEHTGGGCFWLRSYRDTDAADGDDDTAPYLVITAHGDVLSGDDTPEQCRNAWTVGTYPTGWAGQGEDGQFLDPVADETLPVIVRDLMRTL